MLLHVPRQVEQLSVPKSLHMKLFVDMIIWIKGCYYYFSSSTVKRINIEQLAFPLQWLVFLSLYFPFSFHENEKAFEKGIKNTTHNTHTWENNNNHRNWNNKHGSNFRNNLHRNDYGDNIAALNCTHVHVFQMVIVVWHRHKKRCSQSQFYLLKGLHFVLVITGFSLQQPQQNHHNHQQQHHRHMRQTPSLYQHHHSIGVSSSGGGGGYPVDMTVTPYIEAVKYNTTVFVGQTAYLPCVVKHLGDKTVSVTKTVKLIIPSIYFLFPWG